MILNHKINKCIKQHHNKLLHGHLKIITTIKILQRNCYFTKMKYYVIEHITKYI